MRGFSVLPAAKLLMFAALTIAVGPFCGAWAQAQNSMQVSPVHSCSDTPRDRTHAIKIAAACGATILDKQLPASKRLEAAKRWLKVSKDTNIWPHAGGGQQLLKAYAELDPDNVYVKLMIARQLLDEAKIAQAITMTNEVLEKDAYNGVARLIRGIAMVRSDNGYTEISDLSEAVRLLPDRHEPLMQLGHVLEHRFKRLDEAAAFYSRALAVDEPGPNLFDIVVYGATELPAAALGRVVLKMKSPEVAIEVLTDLIAEMPKAYRRTQLLGFRIEAYRRSGDIANALRDLNEIIEYAFDHQKPDLFLRRAFFKRELQLFDQAVADIALATASGSLKIILQLQVKLRNAGQTGVDINGEFDAATKAGLIDCMSDKECGASLGTPI